MAVLQNTQDTQDKDQQQGGQPQQTNPGSVGVVGSSNTPQNGPSGAQNSPGGSSPQGTSSGRFTNIKSYLNANKGFNEQGGGLAGKVASNLNTQGQQVQQNIGQAQNTFQTQVNSQLNPLQQGAALVGQAVQNPMDFVKNNNQVQQVAQARDAQYTGPQSLMDLQGNQNQAVLQNQAQNFNQTAQQGQTEQGRYGLLKNMFNRPTYTSGQQNLDNLLIQGNQQQLGQIQGARRNAAQVNKTLTQNVAQAQGIGGDATAQANQIQQNTRNALNQRVGAEQTDINSGYETAKANQASAYQQALNDLKNGNITADEAKNMGITEGQRMYNVDPSTLIRQSADPSITQTASAQNYAQLAALKQLLGNAQSEDASKTLAQFSDPTQAGTANGAAYNFDNAIYQDKLGQAQRELDAKIQANVMHRDEGQAGIDEATNYINQFAQDPAKQAQISAAQSALTQQLSNSQQWGDTAGVAATQAKLDQLSKISSGMAPDDFYNQYIGAANSGIINDSSLAARDRAVGDVSNMKDRDLYGNGNGGIGMYNQRAYEQNKRDIEQAAIDKAREAAGYNRQFHIGAPSPQQAAIQNLIDNNGGGSVR